MKNNINSKKFGWLFVLAALFIGAMACAIFFMTGSEKTIKENNNVTKIDYLYCQGDNLEDAFFKDSSQLLAKHEIKYTFSDGKPDKISYTYTGTFDSSDSAKATMSFLHADYNNYMGKAGIYQESLYPSWNVVESDAVINLFIDNDQYNVATAKFLFMSEEEYTKQKIDNIARLESFYRTKGFSCKTSS